LQRQRSVERRRRVHGIRHIAIIELFGEIVVE